MRCVQAIQYDCANFEHFQKIMIFGAFPLLLVQNRRLQNFFYIGPRFAPFQRP